LSCVTRDASVAGTARNVTTGSARRRYSNIYALSVPRIVAHNARNAAFDASVSSATPALAADNVPSGVTRASLKSYQTASARASRACRRRERSATERRHAAHQHVVVSAKRTAAVNHHCLQIIHKSRRYTTHKQM
jgi:hypothetical protein